MKIFKKQKDISTSLVVLIFLLGLSIFLYPTVSNYINERHSSKVVVNYDTEVEEMSDNDYEEQFARADAFNAQLLEDPMRFYTPEDLTGYMEALDEPEDNGIIGYITIDKIHIRYPIYHGTSEAVLNEAVGHLEGTSLPVGGKGTHAVLSAHRGLPSAKLFSDLPELTEGDRFVITVLNRTLTYEVDEKLVVDPDETEALLVDPDQDYVTLLTCTPYGINTQRLLVRGHRVEDVEAAYASAPVSSEDSGQYETVRFHFSWNFVVPALVLFFIYLLLPISDKRSGERKHRKDNE